MELKRQNTTLIFKYSDGRCANQRQCFLIFCVFSFRFSFGNQYLINQTSKKLLRKLKYERRVVEFERKNSKIKRKKAIETRAILGRVRLANGINTGKWNLTIQHEPIGFGGCNGHVISMA